MTILKIVIDKNSVERYRKYYFEIYPRKRVFPIDKPIPQSLNFWMIQKRFKMNALKQNWKEFGIWIINDLNLQNMMIKNCDITFEYYFSSKARRDPDNFVPKNLMDAFTASGLIEDDDFKHVHSLTIKGNVCKENPRTEIIIDYD